jgi:16S rRNA U516 pseudouridylate synthase RsuA-like enzyme
MLQGQGHAVKRLVRVTFGPISLGGMPEGSVRELGVEEVASLKNAVGGGGGRDLREKGGCEGPE